MLSFSAPACDSTIGEVSLRDEGVCVFCWGQKAVIRKTTVSLARAFDASLLPNCTRCCNNEKIEKKFYNFASV